MGRWGVSAGVWSLMAFPVHALPWDLRLAEPTEN